MTLAQLALLLGGAVNTIGEAIKADPEAAEREVRKEMADAIRKVENDVADEVARVRGMSRSELDDLMADLLSGD